MSRYGLPPDIDQRVNDAADDISKAGGMPLALMTQIIWGDIRRERLEYGIVADQTLDRILNEARTRYLPKGTHTNESVLPHP